MDIKDTNPTFFFIDKQHSASDHCEAVAEGVHQVNGGLRVMGGKGGHHNGGAFCLDYTAGRVWDHCTGRTGCRIRTAHVEVTNEMKYPTSRALCMMNYKNYLVLVFGCVLGYVIIMDYYDHCPGQLIDR